MMLMVFLIVQSVFAQISGEAILTSNFLWRGTTFTENKPAIQTELEYNLPFEHGLGLFVSNAEFSDPALGRASSVNHEVDFFFHKAITRKNWSLDFNYSYFTFGEAYLFNTDEWNLKFFYRDWMMELSYMDDFFGYQSTYFYLRLGKEFMISNEESISVFWGLNHFSNPKGSPMERCLDSGCSESAYGLNGAGNSDYYDVYLAYTKRLEKKLKMELAYNYTNRYEYLYEGAQINKEKANDNVFLITLTYDL
jgi:hypothetical protein